MSKLFIVGIGPGGVNGMTLEAFYALKSVDVIVGFTTYVNLIKADFADKEFIATGMGAEKERCQIALDKAKEGIDVAVVCSGDSCVYGMAGLIYELSENGYDAVEITTIAGVSAVLSGSALLGAAVGHDFATVSLSDYMISWEKIEARLKFLAKADMVVALYNVRSKKRPDALKNACEILMSEISPDTVCGAARNIGRENEAFEIMTLKELRDYDADMFTTAFVGNSVSKVINGRMVTPRGYFNE